MTGSAGSKPDIADFILADGDPLEDPRLPADPTNVALVAKAGAVVRRLR